MTGFDELDMRVRPLSRPLPDPTYAGYHSSPFSASWEQTVVLLWDELRHLEPRESMLELDLTERQIRVDGSPRTGVKPASAGVALVLVETMHGDLRYPCSTFRGWQDNVRAIALALEALRKVDRYGVTQRGEQYAGWKQLTAGGPSVERGRELITRHGGVIAALKATHPDHGGDPREFADVQAARA